MTLIIEAKDLSKIYENDGVKTPALKNVSLNVKKGEFLAVMGPSGSGKSTLLHLLGLLDRPTHGSYIFNGKDTIHFDDDQLAHFRNKKVGFIFQAFNLLPRTTVLDNVKLPLMYAQVPDKKQEELARKAINLVGLKDRTLHETSQLSGGEKQRVAIARALVNNPEVIFADEPTGNLDSKSGGQIMEYIKNLHQNGNTIILITHERYTAEYAERIIHLKDGELESDQKVKTRRTSQKDFIK